MSTIPLVSSSDTLYDASQVAELQRVYRTMEVPPFDTPPAKLEKARAAILTGRITLAEGEESGYEVMGTTGTLYQVTSETCTCDAARFAPQGEPSPCYHVVCVQLYLRWQQALRPLATPPPPAGNPPGLGTLLPPAARPVALPELPALGLRPIAAILADLRKPLPLSCVGLLPKTTKRPTEIPFLHWTTVATVLDTYAPGWKGEVTRVEKIGDKCAIFYRLTLYAQEGAFTQDDGGMEDEDVTAYGDAVTNALATAFKRAAAKFGVGRDLYERADIARALTAHFQEERIAALAALGKAVDAAGLPRADTIAWLRCHTGVSRNADLPFHAIRALTLHLERYGSNAPGSGACPSE